MPNSRFALHGLAPPKITVCAPFLPLIHGLCAFFRPLSTPVSTAPSPPPSQFTVCTSRFARLRSTVDRIVHDKFRIIFRLTICDCKSQILDGPAILSANRFAGANTIFIASERFPRIASNLRFADLKFSAPKRNSQQQKGSIWEPSSDSRKSGDPRESANPFVRIGPSKSQMSWCFSL